MDCYMSQHWFWVMWKRWIISSSCANTKKIIKNIMYCIAAQHKGKEMNMVCRNYSTGYTESSIIVSDTHDEYTSFSASSWSAWPKEI